MIRSSGITSFLKIISSLIFNPLYRFKFLFFLVSLLFIFSCSPTTRIPGKEIPHKEANINPVSGLRILLDKYDFAEVFSVESAANIQDEKSKIALIKAGNTIECYLNDDLVQLSINGKNFESKKYTIEPTTSDELLNINGKKYRGRIQISASIGKIDLINIIEVEDYVKGVLPKEMPIGKDNENFEALKALAICIRTYAIKKMHEGKIYFDLYGDTRDQVYGGADSEIPISNKAVDETRDVILKYDDEPALIYYHSTCGGFTESAVNVFSNEEIPYLVSIEDGREPYCKISPRFKWQEKFSNDIIVERLKSYSLLDDQNYELKEISLLKKFDSGRISDLEIIVTNDDGDNKSMILHGNEIRSILRTADNKNILWSTLFDIITDDNSIIFDGHGFGHGVGLCQWGAIALSRKGWSYRDILEHYYPGIIIYIN